MTDKNVLFFLVKVIMQKLALCLGVLSIIRSKFTPPRCLKFACEISYSLDCFTRNRNKNNKSLSYVCSIIHINIYKYVTSVLSFLISQYLIAKKRLCPFEIFSMGYSTIMSLYNINNVNNVIIGNAFLKTTKHCCYQKAVIYCNFMFNDYNKTLVITNY